MSWKIEARTGLYNVETDDSWCDITAKQLGVVWHQALWLTVRWPEGAPGEDIALALERLATAIRERSL